MNFSKTMATYLNVSNTPRRVKIIQKIIQRNFKNFADIIQMFGTPYFLKQLIER